MSDGTIVGIIMGCLFLIPIVGLIVWWLFFSSRVEQTIKKSKKDHLMIITKVFHRDKLIKTYQIECHYNDASFDLKAKNDKELAQIYLDRYKKYL